MAKRISFVLSDESVNSYGFRLLTSGVDLEQFKRNPVMYLNHNDWGTPIGRWENIRIEGDKILADPVFDMEDAEGREVAGKVSRGFLKMASVGVRILDKSTVSDDTLPNQSGYTVTRWRLREASIVGVGANHNALRLYDGGNRELSEKDIVELFYKHKKQKKMNKELLELLNLSDGATEAQLYDAVKIILSDNFRLKKTNTELSEKLDAISATERAKEQQEAVKLTDEAIESGKLDAKAKEATLQLFEKDFFTTKAMLDAIPVRQTLKEQLSEADKTEHEKLSEKSWEELDRQGSLQLLKEKYPDTYREKFNERFKK